MLKGRQREEWTSRLRSGDTVIVVSGNDRGKRGKILGRKGRGFIVEGVNVRKRHLRQQQQGAQKQGGIIEMETPILACKLAPCTAEGKVLRLKVRVGEAGQRELVYQDGARTVVYRQIAERSSEK